MSISYDRDEHPWYKYFWPWFLFGVPFLTVVGGIHFIYLSMQDPDGLVMDDYYKQGLAINRTLEKDHHAVTLGVTAEGRFDFEKKLVTLKLTSLPEWPATVTLSLLHPTRAHHDQSITLQKQSDTGEYFGVVASIPAGNWHMMLEPPEKNWRLRTRFHWPGNPTWSMQPKQE